MSKISALAPLDAVGWLAQQPPAFRDWAATVGNWRRYQRGRVLYDAGDPCDGLYGLAEGALARALETRQRRDLGVTAPADGLCLDRVLLDDEGTDAWPEPDLVAPRTN